MFQKGLLTMLMASVASIALPAYAQSEGGRGPMDVAVQASGSFVTATTQNGIDNTSTKSGGLLASYRYFFSTHHGVEANYGYALNTQSYSSAAGIVGVKTNSHEVSGAYVFRMPVRNITPFALAGVGALVFDPKQFVGASTQTCAAFVYGAAPTSTSRATSSCARSIAASSITRRPMICRRSLVWTASRIGRSLLLDSATGSNNLL